MSLASILSLVSCHCNSPCSISAGGQHAAWCCVSSVKAEVHNDKVLHCDEYVYITVPQPCITLHGSPATTYQYTKLYASHYDLRGAHKGMNKRLRAVKSENLPGSAYATIYSAVLKDMLGHIHDSVT